MIKNEAADLHVREQSIAAVIDTLNVVRQDALIRALDDQDLAFQEAVNQINGVRDFINDDSHILGSATTKHGEVAEHMEVGIRRAYDAFFQRDFSATFDGVGRLAPEDYIINGVDVQSKYINGARETLKHVRDHFDKYSYWGESGEYYHIPKDQFDIIHSAYEGHVQGGISSATAEKIRNQVQEICNLTGKSFDEMIRPGLFDYREVQLRVAPLTLDREEADLRSMNDGIKDGQFEAHQPSIEDATEGAAWAAAVAAGLNFGYGIYKKHKSGRSVFMFTASDWKDVGLRAGSAGAGGAVSGVAIYGLTNYADMSAPLAGAVASTARGIYTQIDLYKAGKLSHGALIDNSMALGCEAGIVAMCAVGGQFAIPIPVLGSVVGSAAGRFLAGILKDRLGDSSKSLINELDRRTTAALSQLDEKNREVANQLFAEFSAIDDLLLIAFDLKLNRRLAEVSIELAVMVGVSDDQIIRDQNSLDEFMSS